MLWAGADRHFPVVHAERLHGAVPGSVLHVIAWAVHWMPWHRAAEVAEQIGAFLEQTAPPLSAPAP